MKFFLLLLFILPTHSFGEDVPVKDPVLQRLLLDFSADMNAFDQFHGPSGMDPLVKNYMKSWMTWMNGGAQGPAPVLVTKGKTWNFGLDLLAKADKKPVPKLENMKLDVPLAGKSSAMKDPILYIQQRIGKETFNLIQEEAVTPEVYGGNLESWKNTLKAGEEAIHIPSPFEDWGIAKYYIPDVSGKPRLVFVIPPFKEYVLHYLAMFEVASGKTHSGNLNLEDREAFSGLFKSSLLKLSSVVKKDLKQAWVMIGYQSKIEQMMKTEGKLVFSESDSVLSISGYQMKGSGKMVVSVGIRPTVWGEGTSFLVKEILPYQPQGILFMGSAGYLLDNKTSYANYSPLGFYDGSMKLLDLNSTIKGGEGIHFSTFSPLAETVDQVDRWKKAGILSVDVEEARVAEAIFKYNQTAKLKVQFEAINLITDFPKGTGDGSHPEFDLNVINQEEKDQARIDIVEKALTHVSEAGSFCDQLMKGRLPKIGK